MKLNTVEKEIIAIIIPVHNGIGFTRNCLNMLVPQISKTVSPRFKYEIIVTDDGSTDGTSGWIKENYPSVHIVTGNGDLWWSGGVNKGVVYSLENLKAEYILWWNNDIIPAEDYFSRLLEITSEYTRDTIIGSKIFVFNLKNVLWGMGGKFDSVTGTRHMYFENTADREDFSKPMEVDWFPGMGTILHKSVFEKIGMLDEKIFPQYHGDSDYTYRAKKAGFKLVAHPGLVIYNDTSNTGLKHSGSFRELCLSLYSIKSNYNFRKDVAFYRKHSKSFFAYFMLFKKYFRYIGGFYKWKLLNAFGIKKNG